MGRVRLATWNVNSVTPGCPGCWTGYERPAGRALPAGDQVADGRLPASARLAALGYEAAVHGDGRWNGVALLSRVGLDDVVRRLRPAAREPATREARRGRSSPRPAAGSGSGRCTCRTAATPDPTHYAVQAAWLEALRPRVAGAPPAPTVRGLRRLQRRADRRRRVGPAPSRLDPRHRAGAGRAGGPAGPRPDDVVPAPAEGPDTRSPTGTTGPACSTRTRACASTWCGHASPARSAQLRRPGGAQGQGRPRPRPGRGRPPVIGTWSDLRIRHSATHRPDCSR